MITIGAVKGKPFLAQVKSSAAIHLYYVLCNQVTRNSMNNHYKYFASLKFAKTFFTLVPIASVLLVFLPFAIYQFAVTAGFMGIEKASEIALINAVFTICTCILETMMFLPKGGFKSIATYSGIVGFLTYSFLEGISFNLPANINFILAFAVYLIGSVAIIASMNLWWNKSGRNIKECNYIPSGTIAKE